MRYYSENELLDLQLKYKDDYEVLSLISAVSALQSKNVRDEETGELLAQ